MIKYLPILLLLGATQFLSAKELTPSQVKACEDCIEILKENKKLLYSYMELTEKQRAAIKSFVSENLKARLVYENNLYYVYITGEIDIYDMKRNKIIKIGSVKVKKKKLYEFQPKLRDPRPLAYFSSIFKLGGGVFYNTIHKKFSPDIFFLFEFLSFDRSFGIHGISLNVGLGLHHIGGSLGYQFVSSTYFKNTSITLGYSYDFMEKGSAPFIGLSLNF